MLNFFFKKTNGKSSVGYTPSLKRGLPLTNGRDLNVREQQDCARVRVSDENITSFFSLKSKYNGRFSLFYGLKGLNYLENFRSIKDVRNENLFVFNDRAFTTGTPVRTGSDRYLLRNPLDSRNIALYERIKTPIRCLSAINKRARSKKKRKIHARMPERRPLVRTFIRQSLKSYETFLVQTLQTFGNVPKYLPNLKATDRVRLFVLQLLNPLGIGAGKPLAQVNTTGATFHRPETPWPSIRKFPVLTVLLIFLRSLTLTLDPKIELNLYPSSGTYVTTDDDYTVNYVPKGNHTNPVRNYSNSIGTLDGARVFINTYSIFNNFFQKFKEYSLFFWYSTYNTPSSNWTYLTSIKMRQSLKFFENFKKVRSIKKNRFKTLNKLNNRSRIGI